ANKGKTVKIPLSSSIKNDTVNQAEILAQLKEVLGILEKNSLLTPYKKLGDIYSLTVKNSTIEAIATVYDQKVQTSEIDAVKKDMKKTPLLYTVDAGGKKTLFVNINEKDAVGTIRLSKQNNYSFVVDVKNPTKSGESVYILVQKDFLDAKILASGINITTTYKDKMLSFAAEGFAQNLSIQGPLSDENTNINFTFNGKKVGNITWKKGADTCTYDVLFEMTIAEILNKFHMNGESTVTRGTFPVVAPKDFIEKKRDSENAGSMPFDFSNL
ncbi:MAG: hypothetical protein PHH70_04450, partial [Candidatus Gracilibacteria bacterium]|nr:hypothetical protein [Candidatus Gracilibacteria bacterium]